jgi:hypothetical protein
MDPANFERTLRAFQRRAPFNPFTVALVNGDRFQVDHPEALVLRDGVAVYVAVGGVPWLFDHESVSQVVGDTLDSFSTVNCSILHMRDHFPSVFCMSSCWRPENMVPRLIRL